MVPLSPATAKHVETMFAEGERATVVQLLEEQCAETIPGWSMQTPTGLERIRFAVLKVSEGSLDQLQDVVRRVNVDWRGVIVSAGFGVNVKAHLKWDPQTS